MTRPLLKALEKETGKTIYTGLDVTGGILAGTVDFGIELATNFQLLCILFGIGEVIIFTRDFLAEAGGIIAVFAQVFLFQMGVLYDICAGVADAILVLTFGLVHIKPLPFVDATKAFDGEWYNRLANVGTECADYTDWQKVVGFFLGQLTRDNVCVFLRYIEPVPWLWDFFYGALDWITVDPRPAPEGGNCEDTATEWLCASLGLGYVIINLLIPLLLAFLIIKAYKPVIADLLSWAWTTLHFLFHFIFLKLLRGAIRGVDDIRCFWQEFLCERALEKHRRK